MNISYIVFKELKERKIRLATSIFVIFLAIAVVVSLQLISNSLKKAVAKQLRNLGANMVVLPRALSITGFHTADYSEAEMPESYFYKLTGSGLVKEKDAKMQLSSKVKIDNHLSILTGILSSPLEGEGRERGGIFLGNEIAKLLNKRRGDRLIIKNKKFEIIKILPEKGTMDDIRIFIQLKTLQKLLKRGRVINAVKIISSGGADTGNLAEKIELLLPDTKVVTKKRIAQTQANTIRALRKYFLLLLIVVLLITGINIANYMFINVRERRREIGTLLAMGATPRIILEVFLQKAVLLGFAGGLTGYIFGAFLAVILGPKIVKAPVSPALEWCFVAIIAAIIFSVASAYIPAKKAANLDPAVILQEE